MASSSRRSLGAGDHSADPSGPMGRGRGRGRSRPPGRLSVIAELSEPDQQEHGGGIGTFQQYSFDEVTKKEYSIFEFAMPLRPTGPTVEPERPHAGIIRQRALPEQSVEWQGARPKVSTLKANKGVSSPAYLGSRHIAECVGINKGAASSLTEAHNMPALKRLTLQEPAGGHGRSALEQRKASRSRTEHAAHPIAREAPEPYRWLLLQALEDPGSLTPDEVDELVTSILETNLDELCKAEAGATMCLVLVLAQQNKCPWNEHGFLDHMLNACVDWFNKREVRIPRRIRWPAHQQPQETAVSPYCWKAYVVFLAELLAALTGTGSCRASRPFAPPECLFCLAVLLCDCGQIMLQQPAENVLHEVLVLRYALVRVGKTADSYAPSHVQALMCLLRKAFLDLRYSVHVQRVLLEMMELCASQWEFDMAQEKYYSGP